MRRRRMMSADEARADGLGAARGTLVAVLLAVVLYGAVILVIWAATATASVRTTYATCYDLLGPTAHGGWRWPAGPRVAAHNYLPAFQRIRLVGRPFLSGMRRFTVVDTGPALADGHLDLWSSWGCTTWGVRRVHYKLGWRRP